MILTSSGLPGGPLGGLLCRLGGLLGALEASWAVLEASWSHLGSLGAILAVLEANLEAILGHLANLEAILSCLGGFVGDVEVDCGRLRALRVAGGTGRSPLGEFFWKRTKTKT